MHHPVLVAVLLGLSVLIALLSCVGVMVMRDAYQRLQFSVAVVTWSTWLIVGAVWVDEHDPQARIKSLLIGLLLFGMNSVLATATAKATRIRQMGHWEPRPSEKIPIVENAGIAGSENAPEEHQA